MKNFRQNGDVVTVPAPYNVLSGGGVLVGQLFGVASTDAASGADVEIKTNGVFELSKTSAEAWTVGALIYSTTAGVATTTATSNVLIGKALEVAANPSATGIVRLSGA